MAFKLSRPLVIRRLVELGHADSIESACGMVDHQGAQVRDALESVAKNHPVLLSRPSVLSRAAILAFEPVLIEGDAIRIHPLVWQGLGGKFDGEQAVVHLPLSIDAQAEAAVLMMPVNNLFSVADGKLKFWPSQDIVVGCFYLTLAHPHREGEAVTFASMDHVDLAWSLGKIDTHARIKVRLPPGRLVNRDPHQVQLPRGSQRAGVPQQYVPPPQDTGRPEHHDRPLPPPGPQTGRRGRPCRGCHARLRHDGGRDQKRSRSWEQCRRAPGRVDPGASQSRQRGEPRHR